MTDETKTSAGSAEAVPETVHRRRVQAARLPTPTACGCGLPVAFDPVKQEFFCIGCGASQVCLCRSTLMGSQGRPVKVA